MTTLSLNSNLPALQAARSLKTVTTDLSSLFERLSSGTRINHASDDPAGSAEASMLNAAGRVYTQATRNINDSISFFNVAESATSALKNILDRMGELATQASNGVLSDTQRQALDEESQSFQTEYGRILTTAKFNGTNVFTTGELATQAGFGAKAVILADISSGSSTTITITTTGTDTITTTTTTTTTTAQGDGTFQAKQSFRTGNQPDSVAIGDFNGDGKSDLVTADSAAGTASVLLGNGNGTFQAKQFFRPEAGLGLSSLGDFNGDGSSDLVLTDSTLKRAAWQRQWHVSGQASLRVTGSCAWSLAGPTSTATAKKTWRPRKRATLPMCCSATATARFKLNSPLLMVQATRIHRRGRLQQRRQNGPCYRECGNQRGVRPAGQRQWHLSC